MSHLMVGDPAPKFDIASTSNPIFHFDMVGGYRVILSFLGSSQIERSSQVLQQFLALQNQLELLKVVFFGVLVDPDDVQFQDQIEQPSYCKLCWDFDLNVSTLYGAYQASDHPTQEGISYTPTTFVLNQNLQIVEILPIEDPVQHVREVLESVQGIPVFAPPQLANRQAPVLLIPNVFDRSLCQRLIDLYTADGGEESGFMREVDGKTVRVLDHSFKKRRDVLLEEPTLLQHVNDLILRRVKPEIEKVFQFSITRFERHLIACYEAHNQGCFNRHRDNTTKGTVHRRFAMSLNLNPGDYEGGYLWFPEYGSQLYRPESGEAVIFSCSLLHEATPVTSGRRFVLLSFFYGDEDAKLREQNYKYVALDDESTSEPVSHTSSKSSKASLGFRPKKTKRR